MKKYCRHYINGKCKYSNDTNLEMCKFVHEDNICRENFFRTCKFGDKCRYKHVKLKKINTETFEPNYNPPDANIVLASPNKKYSNRDIIIASNLFENPTELYEKLIDEMQTVEMKMWHGDTHLIADDHTNWKSKSPTFNMIVTKLAEYFNMDVKASRYNWYRDPTMWKPYHHDAAAIDPEKAKKQNLTIGISFGGTRDIGFEHATTKTKIFIPLENGMVYGFGKDINIEWRHGIPPLSNLNNNSFSELSRISIIVWGAADLY
jgi:hypothetical protein